MTKAKTNEPTYLTTSELARFLRVTPRTVSRWARMGLLPCSMTPGGHYRYPLAALGTMYFPKREEDTE